MVQKEPGGPQVGAAELVDDVDDDVVVDDVVVGAFLR